MKKIYITLFIILASMLVFGYVNSNNDNLASQASFPQTYANDKQQVKTATQVELENTNDPDKLSQDGSELLHAGNYEQSINEINAERDKQENAQANENSNDQYYDLRFEDYTDLAGGRVLYAYASSYDASEAKANSLAEACSSGPNVRGKYDAVMVYLTDLNTGVQYEGDYKITDFYS